MYRHRKAVISIGKVRQNSFLANLSLASTFGIGILMMLGKQDAYGRTVVAQREANSLCGIIKRSNQLLIFLGALEFARNRLEG